MRIVLMANDGELLRWRSLNSYGIKGLLVCSEIGKLGVVLGSKISENTSATN